MTAKLLDILPSIKPRREAERPSADSDDWFTPMKLFDQLYQEFFFTVDAAGCVGAPVSRAIGRWYDVKADGLKQGYDRERVWCNPPYSDIAPWVERALISIVSGEAELWTLLLPSWTDRAWWHDFIEPNRFGRTTVHVEVRFIRGRVKFGYPGNPEAKGKAQGGFDPSAIVIFRPARSHEGPIF